VSPRALAVLAVALGCGRSEATLPPPAIERALHRVDAMAHALDALVYRDPLDYHLPFDEKPSSTEAIERFVTICAEGDGAACRIAATLTGWRRGAKTTAAVVASCKAGDQLSCHALPHELPDAAALPGAAGRSKACSAGKPGCDVVALRAECEAGFVASCRARAISDPTVDLAQLQIQLRRLVRAACEANLWHECAAYAYDHAEDDAAFALAQVCPFWSCPQLAEAWRARGDLIKARDADERRCQYVSSEDDEQTARDEQHRDCLELAVAYARGVYREPTPSRGALLRAWACDTSSPPSGCLR
jgi:hypothetical protein